MAVTTGSAPDRHVRVELDLHIDHLGRLHGHVVTTSHGVTPFWGVLEMVAVLDALATTHDT